MEKTLEHLIDQLPYWPKSAQEHALKSLLDIEMREVGPYRLSASEDEAAAEGLQEARQGEFMSDDEVAAFSKRHGV